MRVVTLTLPMPPNIVNGSYMGHWSARRKAVNDWKGRAIALERGLRGRPERMERATLAVVFYVGDHPLDDDNATARLKPAIDLLKERGLIVDDKRPHLTLAGIPEQRATSPRLVILTLTEVPPT